MLVLIASTCGELSSSVSNPFPGGAMVKNPPANTGDTRDVGLIPGLGRSPGVENGNPLQSSCLENSMDKEPGGLHLMGLQRARHSQVIVHT